MNPFSAALSVLALLLGACAVQPPGTGFVPSTPRGITAASGAQQARTDLAASRWQFLEAGTRAVSAPGVPVDDPCLGNLPRRRLPSGCTTPNASSWVAYAEAYNREVLAALRKQAGR